MAKVRRFYEKNKYFGMFKNIYVHFFLYVLTFSFADLAFSFAGFSISDEIK